MPLPDLTGDPPALPARQEPYRMSFAELGALFVDAAPTDQREYRALRLEALQTHARVVAGVFRGYTVRAWIDGGFCTHKTWSHPEDVDVVYLVPPIHLERAHHGRVASMWTLSEVSAIIGPSASAGGGPGGPKLEVDALSPLAGLVDAYVTPDTAIERRRWHRQWSSVNGPDGTPIPGVEKGFVEVLLNA